MSQHSEINEDLDSISKVNFWIQSQVPGKSFADVGGIGMEAINEKVTLAYKSGASSVSMIDIRPIDYYEWDRFISKCKNEGLEDYSCIDKADINDIHFHDKVGEYDLVYCAGIVYHLPNPLLGLINLGKIVKNYLIINTVIAPERIENAKGILEYKGSLALFLPGLNEEERAILNEHYTKKFNLTIDFIAPRLEDKNALCPWFENGEPTCWPYWWLFTPSSFKALIQMIGFEILDYTIWEEHTLTLFARKNQKLISE